MDPLKKPQPPGDHASPWAGMTERLSAEIGALRETSARLHELFAQAIARSREELKEGFNSFAAETQRAYQRLRHEMQGERRVSVALLNELLEIGLELGHIVSVRPQLQDAESLGRWAQAVEVEARKVGAALERHGIHAYEATVGSVYDPAMHERVAGRRVNGMEPGRVAEQLSRGYASRQPDFVLRRPKVVVSE